MSSSCRLNSSEVGRPCPRLRHPDRDVDADEDDVASLCCYLASDEAAFVTGQVLAVNGGTYV